MAKLKAFRKVFKQRKKITKKCEYFVREHCLAIARE